MTPEEVVAACNEAGVRLVRFLYCDNGGVVRAKAAHVDRLADRIRTGIGLTVAMQAMNSLDQLQPVEGMGPVGEIRLVPDPDTFRVIPYAPRSAAMLVDHRRTDGAPYEAGPRNFLRRMSDGLAERGMVLRCAVENEYSLARREGEGYVPIDESLCFSTIGMTASQDVTDAIVGALDAQGIQLEQYYAELGHGQQEISVEHLPVLEAADVQILVRETIRAVATAHGLVASLAPKPFSDQAGNGAHIHFSLWDTNSGANLFHDPEGRYGLSTTAERFAAGILAHTPALLAMTAPSVNSFQRLLPQHWSSAFVCWGLDNREATVRVPSTYWGLEAPSTNLEFKPSDASCNPYLAFGALIAAGLDGIDSGLNLPDPVAVDPATIADDEREAMGIVRYPTTADEALDRLEGDEVLTGALGELLTVSYVAVRRSEAAAHADLDDEARCRSHFLKY
jgi:glutamine synthetase